MKDKVTAISTTATKAIGAAQDLAGGTLNVASTSDFDSTGLFKVGGASGTCAYTGKTASSFTGVTGCTGMAKELAVVKLIAKAPGIYKWTDSSSSWDAQTDPDPIPSADVLPGSPSSGDYFKLAAHEVVATAKSGAGAEDVGIAGALALNIVSNHTRGVVSGGADVAAGTGNVVLRARSNSDDTADASSDAKGGTVGVGASLRSTSSATGSRVRPSRTARRSPAAPT